MSEGFIGLYRGYFNGPFWNEERVFSRAEAWLDLLQFAAFVPTERFINGKSIHHMIGEFVAAERFLEKRWSWSRTKVRNFIAFLLKNHKLDQRKDQGLIVLKVCDYDTYVKGRTKKDTTGNTISQTDKEPPEYHRSTKDNKDKKVNKDKKGIMSSSALDDAKLLLSHLNTKAKKQFRPIDTHLDLIRSRLKEPGVTPQGIREMIDSKCGDWLNNPEKSKYLRPQTLFAKNNFAPYYDQRNESFSNVTTAQDHAAGW